jgi:peptide deformylase
MPPRLHLAGSPILRSVSKAVASRHDSPALKSLLAHMQSTLKAHNGQGISAPQLGKAVRAFMLAGEEDGGPPLVVINPRILRRSSSHSIDWESCLSIPDVAALVSRPQRIDAEYETFEGEAVRCVFSGDRARVFQHELDHLDGVLYTARCIPASLAHVSMLRSERTRTEIIMAAMENAYEGGASSWPLLLAS